MSSLIPPDAIVGSYRLAGFLGAGGMGEVHRATHMSTGQVVAIKVLSAPEIDARWLARVYHEARVLQGLSHPNIVKLHELVTREGRPCLVLEYAVGESLADVLKRRGRLVPRDALRVLHALADAVAHVHTRDIVHRDLKPANVRVTADGNIKLLDFGISKSPHAAGLTQTGNVIGTPRYLSPEQLLGHDITPATDVWALGVLFYEMITGATPFAGTTEAMLWSSIDAVAYEPPSRTLAGMVDPATLRELDRIVASCLTRDPLRRPTAAKLAATAAAVFGTAQTPAPAKKDQPASPAPWQAPSGEQVKSWLERHWLMVTAVSAAVVLLALAIALSPLFSRTATSSGTRAGSHTRAAGSGHGAASADAGVHHIDVFSGRATVVVNGKPLGETPIDYVGPIGETVKVELRQDGFEPLKEEIQITTTGTSTFTMRRTGEEP
jgi:eukaryotic-like serine/threonine-protein kinase